MPMSIRRGVGRDRTTPLPDSDLLVLSTVSRVRAWTLTGLATVALATTLIHRQALAALAVTVTSSLRITDVKYGWLSSALAGAFLIGSMPGARLVQLIGPKLGLALTVAFTSIVIGMHSIVGTYMALLWLRVAMGLGAAMSMPAAAQTIHRVLPFKDRARGIGLLYLGNSLGSALCAPIAIMLESKVGWRATFVWVAAIGIVWIPAWAVAAFSGDNAAKSGASAAAHSRLPDDHLSIFQLARISGLARELARGCSRAHYASNANLGRKVSGGHTPSTPAASGRIPLATRAVFWVRLTGFRRIAS